MTWQYAPYSEVLVLATVAGAVATVLTWQRRADPAARWAAYANGSIALWAGLHLLVVSSAIYEVKLAAFKLALVNIGVLVIAVLGYVLCFVGREAWLSRRRLVLLSAVPLLALLALLTDGYHGWYLVDPRLETAGTRVELTYGRGPLWYAYGVLCYSIVAVALGLLARMFRTVRNVYRALTFVVFLVILLPVGVTTFSTMGVSPLPHFLLLPHVYLATSALAVLAMTSVRFVRMLPIDRLLARFEPGSGNVVPLARDYVMEEVDDGILVLDDEGRIVDINSTGKLMIGADRPLGRYVGEVARSDRIVDNDDLEAALREGRADLADFGGEIWVEAPSGERCYDVRITPVESGDARVGSVVLLHDITERKRREEELEEREDELTLQKENLQRQKAALVRQNERLEAQTRKLEHQNERLDEFASIVSHDLRNPLNVAEGYLDGIRTAAERGDPVDPDLVDEVSRSTERMERIIRDALTLARHGKAITRTEPVDVGSVASEAWEHVDTADAALEIDLADGGPLIVEGDRSRLLTVFENLFRNSVEHGGAERAEPLTVTVGRLANRNGFYVADDGPGIPEELRDEVLEHGYTTNSEGTGLGLSIVQDVIRAHGWSLEVGEREGGGARFDVSDVELATDADGPTAIDGDELSTVLEFDGDE